MTDEDLELIARIMYDNYCAGVGGKAFNGDPLPNSTVFFNDDTKRKQADAWRKAAQAAIEAIRMLDNKF